MIAPPLRALAEALHDNDDTCNANHYVPFADCATQEWDLTHADEVLDSLRASGWMVVRDPAGTLPLPEDFGQQIASRP
jgi:hypothetical protein